MLPRLALTRSEGQAVAHELGNARAAPVPPGLVQPIQSILALAPRDWTEEACAFELHTRGADVVRTILAKLTGHDRDAGQRAASVAEAMQIIRDHQRRRED